MWHDTHLVAIFQETPGKLVPTSPFWILLELKIDGSGGDTWSCKTCKAPVKLSSPTPSFLQARRPSCHPTVSEHWREQVSYSTDLLTPSSPGVFRVCLWPLIAPGYILGGLPCLSLALWRQYPRISYSNACLELTCDYRVHLKKTLYIRDWHRPWKELLW